MSKDIQIKSIEQLKQLCKGKDQLDCYAVLGGFCRSSKTLIPQEDNAVVVVHEIDGHTSCVNSIEKLMTSKKTTTIAEAIKKGCFYAYGYEGG